MSKLLNVHSSTNEGKPLVILHGLLGCSDNWQTFLRYFSSNFKVVLPDFRNHGNSFHSEYMTLLNCVDDLNQLFESMKLDKISMIGHSMGGKVAMMFAQQFPEKMKNLVIVDIAPKKYPIRHFEMIETLQQVCLSNFQKREEIDIVLRRHFSDLGFRNFIMKNITRDEHKKFVWKPNLENIKNNLGHLMGGIKNRKIDIPTLFLLGEQSKYVLKEDYFSIQSYFPHSKIEVIADAGHWLHVDAPKIFIEKIEGFFGI